MHGWRSRSGCSRCSCSAQCGFGCSPARSHSCRSRLPACCWRPGLQALTHQATALSDAAHAGHGLAFGFAVLAAAQAIVAAAYVVWVSRVKVSTSVRRAVGAVAVAAVLGALIGVFATYGAPPTLARHAYDSFVSPPTGGTDLNGRLFTLSNHGRTVLWRAALDDFRAHPVVGSGAGSFGRWWLAHRTTFYSVGEAHNLYVQTLAEGGVVGFALLVALLGLPLIAAVRARRHPLVAPAFGAYVAFLVHAAVDWDWQMPAVTLLALFAAAVPVAATRGSEPRAASGRVPSRVVVGAARGAYRGRLLRRTDREHRSRTRAVRDPQRWSGARRSATRRRRIGGRRGRRRPCACSARAASLLATGPAGLPLCDRQPPRTRAIGRPGSTSPSSRPAPSAKLPCPGCGR